MKTNKYYFIMRKDGCILAMKYEKLKSALDELIDSSDSNESIDDVYCTLSEVKSISLAKVLFWIYEDYNGIIKETELLEITGDDDINDEFTDSIIQKYLTKHEL